MKMEKTKNKIANVLKNASRIKILMAVMAILFSTNNLWALATGGQPGQFLVWGAGSRSLAMGKAFFAVSDDASATYWNPAGLTQLQQQEVMALHSELPPAGSGILYDFISYVRPTPRYGTFGVNLTRLYAGGFEKIAITYDATKTNIIDIQSLGTFEDVQMALTGNYAKKIRQNLSIGVSGKYISHRLDTSANSFFTFDTTLLLEGLNHRFPDLRLAFGINNLLSAAFGDTEDKLPLIFRFGSSHPFLKKKLLVAFDIDKNLKANMNWHIGTEYWLVEFLAMRIGFDGEEGIRETTAGFGVKYQNYTLDYAFAMHDMGLSHRLSASWRFGPSIVKNREDAVRKFLQKGIAAYSAGKFMEAYKEIESAYSIDPTNNDVRIMMDKLQTVVAYLPAATSDSEDEVAIRKGVVAYLAGDDQGAVNALRYGYYKKPDNLKILALLNKIEKDLGITLTEMYKEEAVGFTIVDRKIYEARQAIIDGKYDQALIKCQEVLNLEPNNVTALEIMGSAFYMMNQPDKAREIWMKVIEIDPTNRVVPEFLNQLK